MARIGRRSRDLFARGASIGLLDWSRHVSYRAGGAGGRGWGCGGAAALTWRGGRGRRRIEKFNFCVFLPARVFLIAYLGPGRFTLCFGSNRG